MKNRTASEKEPVRRASIVPRYDLGTDFGTILIDERAQPSCDSHFRAVPAVRRRPERPTFKVFSGSYRSTSLLRGGGTRYAVRFWPPRRCPKLSWCHPATRAHARTREKG